MTPNYVIGTTELWPNDPHVAPSSQNRWEGITFSAGSGVRIYPQAAPSSVSPCNDAFLSIQGDNTLITEKRTTGRNITAACAKQPTLVYFPASLDGIVERSGWLFVTEGPTYVAIRPVAGTYHWLTADANHAPDRAQRFIELSNASSPIIFEAGRAVSFDSPVTFQNDILGRPLTYRSGVMQYKSLNATRFTMFKDGVKPPLVNDHTLNYSPNKVFNSPFMQSIFGSGKVTVQFGTQRAIYDFSKPTAPVKTVR